MKQILFSFLMLLGIFMRMDAQRLIQVGDGYSNTSVNTTVFRNNSLVTEGDTQYIAYYAPDGYLVLGKRKLGDSQWILQRSPYKGNVADAHNVISMMVDGAGYIHVAFDHHGHPLNYCRSVEPGSLELGPKEQMTGKDEQDVTYPEFYRMPDGNLIFVYRSGISGRGNLIMNRYDVKTRRWERVQDVLIDGEGKRNAYWQLYVDAQGTIHLSWVWRETWLVETNHDLAYAYSADQGKTWHKSTGETYTLPIREGNAEYAWRIPQNSELINQTSMCTDAEGHPYIVTYWRDADSEVPQYRVVWNDGTRWNMRQVMERKQPFSLKGGGTKMIPIARPRIVVEDDKAYFVFRDAERGSKVSLAYTDDLKQGKWQVKDLTDFSVEAWEPSLDSELWKRRKELHLFVQVTYQGDGEKTVDRAPTPVYVLEVED